MIPRIKCWCLSFGTDELIRCVLLIYRQQLHIVLFSKMDKKVLPAASSILLTTVTMVKLRASSNDVLITNRNSVKYLIVILSSSSRDAIRKMENNDWNSKTRNNSHKYRFVLRSHVFYCFFFLKNGSWNGIRPLTVFQLSRPVPGFQL